MSNQKLQTLKGFRDFLPEDALKRQYLITKIKNVAESMGYDPLETPALESAETLTGKYGNETDRLLYLFKDRGERKVGLRYDQTVPTCRVVGQYGNLVMPFKRYQIQNVWRQEKPQQGRFREFLQVDADVYGVNTPLADAEIISLIYKIYSSLGFKNFKIKLNSREILFDNLAIANIVDLPTCFSILQSIDKWDKVGEDGVRTELLSKNIPNKTIDEIFSILDSVTEPVGNLKKVLELSKLMGVNNQYLSFDPKLVRGLDYYTGTIFEVIIEGYTVGAVLGGGRYDKLIESLSGKNIPGIGFGLGFDRTLSAMEQFNLLPQNKTVTKVLVTIFSDEISQKSIELSEILRKGNINTELFPDSNTKLEKQLKYADKKGIPYVIILGPEEAKNNKIQLKNLKTKEQIETTVVNAISIITSS